MNLKIVTIQKVGNSFVIYLPITWARAMNLQRGDKVVWCMEEGNHETLHLKRKGKHV